LSVPKIINSLSFGDWVAHVFDHPVENPQWYWNLEADEVELDEDTLVDYAFRLFADSDAVLNEFSDAQVNQGLWFLVGESTTDLYALRSDDVALAKRLKCIDAISNLFATTLAERCTEHLSHIDEPGCGTLNSVCYMWWDIFPLSGKPSDESLREIDEHCLAVMENVLTSTSIACQESALHGLGHWQSKYPEKVMKIVDAYLGAHEDLRGDLRNYAMAARIGRVQ